MTEPVAYIRRTSGGTYISQTPIDDNYGAKTDKTLPLYTAEQLHPRVKMTKAEHDEFNKLLLSSAVTIYEVIDTIYKDNGKVNDFSHLYQRLFNRNDKLELENQLELSKLWANFNKENPEETIEIVPTMKWFVRSKKTNGSYKYDYLSRMYDGTASPKYGKKDLAIYFDTKEEAELWTNPLTEAVQLPVEDE